MIKKITLYYHTLKYLRWKQVFYRIFYFIRNRWRKAIKSSYDFNITPPQYFLLQLTNSVPAYFYYEKESNTNAHSFNFLNLKHTFQNEIDWEYAEYGKLWTYNINYFDFLNQREKTDLAANDFLLNTFVENLPQLKTAIEPFPISLRAINWIKYFSKNNIKNEKYTQSLYCQLNILADNLEYHLLGNHLLENGFAMLFGAAFFQDKRFFNIANKILTEELNEQILSDGAHFELCPMYHQIMLFRILDCYNILKNNSINDNSKDLEHVLSQKAAIMLGWLSNMTYKNGSIPHFGDSTNGIAPTSQELFDYAKRLNIEPKVYPLSTSGFRKFQNEHFELITKIGQIGPDYIPGHAHADSLSFELYVNGSPVIVDTGISTYEKNEQRQLERSTQSHNTVVVGNQNSSDVWGGFRVGKRAKSRIIENTPNSVLAEHDGYKPNKHKRQFVLKEKNIEITDFLSQNIEGKAFLHFQTNIDFEQKGNVIEWQNGVITFLGAEKIELEPYLRPPQYNTFDKSKKVVITFKNKLITSILCR